VSRKLTPPHVKAFTVEVVCYDRDGEDVEVPYVLVKFA
jgi:ubiquitin-activating enzyme E1